MRDRFAYVPQDIASENELNMFWRPPEVDPTAALMRSENEDFIACVTRAEQVSKRELLESVVVEAPAKHAYFALEDPRRIRN